MTSEYRYVCIYFTHLMCKAALPLELTLVSDEFRVDSLIREIKFASKKLNCIRQF